VETPNTPFKSSDKIVGYILIAAVAAALGGGLYVALPYLIELAKNTIIFIGELAVLALLAIVFLDPSTWQNIYYKWRNISRNIRKAIIHEDPVGILATVIARLETRLGSIDDNIAKAVGAAKRQSKVIKQAFDQMTQELAMAKTAKAQGKELEIKQHAAAAGRWQKAAEDMQPMEATLLNMKTSLERARDLCASKCEDLRNQKQVLGLKLEALKDGQTAVRGFKRFFGANPDLEMQELAIEEIERQSAEAEAEIEQFIRVINPMLDTQDLRKSAEALAAMEKFNNYLGGSTTEQKVLTDGSVLDAEVIETTATKTGVTR
jgi:hypothetical protein